jgi:hypothetical protein
VAYGILFFLEGLQKTTIIQGVEMEPIKLDGLTGDVDNDEIWLHSDGDNTLLSPEEAQKMAWWLLEAGYRVDAEQQAKDGPHYPTLDDFLAAHPPKPASEFQPCAFWNVDGNQIQIYWSPERDYTQEVSNHSMALHKHQDTGEVIGVTLYSIRQIMSIDAQDE